MAEVAGLGKELGRTGGVEIHKAGFAQAKASRNGGRDPISRGKLADERGGPGLPQPWPVTLDVWESSARAWGLFSVLLVASRP